MVGEKELVNRFTHHPPDEAKKIQHEYIREAALKFARMVDGECPAGREQSLALTKIEEAMFWANAAIARSG